MSKVRDTDRIYASEEPDDAYDPNLLTPGERARIRHANREEPALTGGAEPGGIIHSGALVKVPRPPRIIEEP